MIKFKDAQVICFELCPISNRYITWQNLHLHSSLSLKVSFLNTYPPQTLAPPRIAALTKTIQRISEISCFQTSPCQIPFIPMWWSYCPYLQVEWHRRAKTHKKKQLSFQRNIFCCASTTSLVYAILVRLSRAGKGSQTLALANSQRASRCQHDKSSHSFTSAVNTRAGTFPETLTGSSFIPCRQKSLATSTHIFLPCTLTLASTR